MPFPEFRLPAAPTGLLAAMFVAALACPADAQVLDDDLVPAGRFRLSALPSFTAWDERYGTGMGESGRVPLGGGLTVPEAFTLFPGSDASADALRALAQDATYAPTLGPVQGRISRDVTRINLGAHIGVTDWLTVGIVVPRVKTRSMVDLIFTPDTAAIDLGLNPRLDDAVGVDAFLGAAEASAAEALARADALCAAGDPECAAATDLAARAATFEEAARSAYGASPFFPRAGTGIGTALVGVATALDTDLRAAGLGGLTQPMVLADGPVTEAELARASAAPPGSYDAPLTSRTSLWAWGDVEVGATMRLLPLRLDDGEARLTLLGGVLVRLGTGSAADPDVPLDIGSGDGQVDVEGRLTLHTRPLERIHLRASARYGVQRERTVTLRLAPPGTVLALADARATLLWRPAPYRVIEAEPFWRLTRALSLGGTYRYFGKGADRYRPPGGGVADLDPVVGEMEAATRRTEHHVGIALVYDTVERWRTDRSVRPMQIHARFFTPVAGAGGRVPATTRVEMGIRLLAGIPGIS